MPRPRDASGEPLLAISELKVELASAGGRVELVRDVTLTIEPGEVVGLVGETGAGKSLAAWATIGLLPPAIRIAGGRVAFDGRDLTSCAEAELQAVRGRDISVIVQNPKAALLPTMRIGDQVAQVYRAHTAASRREAAKVAVEALGEVGVGDPARRADQYPHQLSGGQAQRVIVAMALVNRPKLVIADEPTTGLDVTTQAAILDLMMERLAERGAAMWLITHDLGVVVNYTSRTSVMFAGEIVEAGSTRELFDAPRHPYTRGLVASTRGEPHDAGRLSSGSAPDLERRPHGCQFAYRCALRRDACELAPVALRSVGATEVRCVRAEADDRRAAPHLIEAAATRASEERA